MKTNVLQKLKSKWRSTSTTISTESESNPVWYRENFTREETEKFLSTQQIGVFIVRKSETISDCFVLSVKVPKYLNSNQISHYLVLKSKKGYSIRGFSKEFTDLKSLVTHCSFMRDMLPIQLNLDFYNQNKKRFTEFIYYFNSTSSLDSLSSGSSNFSDLSDLDFTPSTSTSTSSGVFDEDF